MSTIVKFLALFCLITNQLATSALVRKRRDVDEYYDTCGLLTSKGYPCVAYQVTTDDGYLLTMHRIPYGADGPKSGNSSPRPVAYLQHGLFCSSADWVINLPNQSLGFLLADAGFDVWMGNFRGNTYSNENSDESGYWQFSWDEMAAYDIPAMVNYALQTTGQSQLYYIGHSEGTLTAFAKFSDDLEFATKIKQFHALGPVSTMMNTQGPLAYLGPIAAQTGWVLPDLGVNQFLPSDSLSQMLAEMFCDTGVEQLLCRNLLFLIVGPDSTQLNMTRVPVYDAHTPAGTSTQNVLHFMQMVHTSTLLHYDYGMVGNLKNYGSFHPPAYNVVNMEVPTAIYYGDKDWLAGPKDAADLLPQISNLIGSYEYSDFNHMDFLWGLEAAPKIYASIIAKLQADVQLHK